MSNLNEIQNTLQFHFLFLKIKREIINITVAYWIVQNCILLQFYRLLYCIIVFLRYSNLFKILWSISHIHFFPPLPQRIYNYKI